MKIKYLTSIFILISTLVFSQNQSDFNEREEMLGTTSSTEVLFHEMINADSIKLNYSGIILGIEKINRKYLSNTEEKITPEKQRELYQIDLCRYREHELKRTIKRAEKILSHPKVMTLSHWIEFDKHQNRTLKYSLYDQLDSKQNFLENSISQIPKIAELIKSKFEQEKYTHLIIASTGWNNDQKKSVLTYNTWLQHISNAAEQNNYKFKPYVIGLTWPSTWKTVGGKIISYFNKANDADEIGMTLMNVLIWKHLAPLMRNYPEMELVLLGHSFGARILTRASHSKILLNNDPENKDQIDLMIAVQGAFSVNRFLNKKSTEGNLYTRFLPWKKFIATNSKSDKAVDNAFYTTMIGNDKSSKKLTSKKAGVRFSLVSVNSEGKLGNPINETIHTIINANELINHGNTPLVGAHSDHQRPQFGNFIFNILNSYK
ncbi:alpha/beta hydrolase [Tenacibaculum sp. 190524A05c]|uniref:alpha/beta hydrolase n=1 Tax=Tenacibaculum platacis TaxID=3137852 RepID=UPI0031FB7DF2